MNIAANKSKIIWIAAIGAVVLLIIAGIALALASNNTQPENTSSAVNTSDDQDPETVASEDEVKQNLATLNADIKQLNSDQEASKAALKENEKQIKVSN